MNKVAFIGNLAKDVNFNIYTNEATGASTVVATTVIAVNRIPRRNAKEKPPADFITVTAFNQMAITMADHLAKGARVGIFGRLRPRKWRDKNGHPRFDMDVVVKRIDFLSPKASQ